MSIHTKRYCPLGSHCNSAWQSRVTSSTKSNSKGFWFLSFMLVKCMKKFWWGLKMYFCITSSHVRKMQGALGSRLFLINGTSLYFTVCDIPLNAQKSIFLFHFTVTAALKRCDYLSIHHYYTFCIKSMR